jgi:hypothetical protein
MGIEPSSLVFFKSLSGDLVYHELVGRRLKADVSIKFSINPYYPQNQK